MKLLNEIQQTLVVKKIRDAGRYKYHNCEDILNAVKPILNGGTVILSDELIAIGPFNYMKATARITDTSGAFVECHGWCKEPLEMMKGMDQCKISGCASSYARKYALNGLFAINDEPDADERGSMPQGNDQTNNNNNQQGAW